MRCKGLVIVALVLAASGCGRQGADGGEVVVYSGRSQSLVEPLLRRFEADTGIKVAVKYGKSAQLALALQEEGEKSPADVFWSQDAGALGVLCNDGRFARLPDDVSDVVAAKFRHAGGEWVATSGRARVFAYAPARVQEWEMPKSVFDLADERWRGRVGWAPLNASFQSFVTAMRKSVGDEQTKRWLLAMKDNGAKAYPKNTAIIEGLAAGEIDLGLPNHYYLLRFKKANPDFPVEQRFFESRDIGNLVNVAGVGVLSSSRHTRQAETLVRYLLSKDAQRFFVDQVFEYPVVDHGISNAALTDLERLIELAPPVDLNELQDLEETLDLLREVGLL